MCLRFSIEFLSVFQSNLALFVIKFLNVQIPENAFMEKWVWVLVEILLQIQIL